jgi:hypothetical protein
MPIAGTVKDTMLISMSLLLKINHNGRSRVIKMDRYGLGLLIWYQLLTLSFPIILKNANLQVIISQISVEGKLTSTLKNRKLNLSSLE